MEKRWKRKQNLVYREFLYLLEREHQLAGAQELLSGHGFRLDDLPIFLAYMHGCFRGKTAGESFCGHIHLPDWLAGLGINEEGFNRRHCIELL